MLFRVDGAAIYNSDSSTGALQLGETHPFIHPFIHLSFLNLLDIFLLYILHGRTYTKYCDKKMYKTYPLYLFTSQLKKRHKCGNKSVCNLASSLQEGL